jgi:hypothetical protein
MATRKKTNPDPAEQLSEVLSAAVEASERYVAARTEVMHRLAEIDNAVIEIVQRAYDAMPAEYQRVITVRADGDEDELTLPDFFRYLMERPGGTRGTFAIAVTENLYDDSDDSDEEYEEEDDADAGEDEASDEETEDEGSSDAGRRGGKGAARRDVDEEDDELGF